MYEKFKSLCSANGITEYKACKDMKIGQNTISNVKNQRPGHPRQFSFETVMKMSNYFGVSPYYFWDPEGKEKT